jgi:hypothetical protein
MAKRVAILQSNYIPWVGYFDIISRVDEFVIYDVVQFTKNDWRNRNRIKTAGGLQWLTIPVVTSGRFGQSVAETRIAARDWTVKHWRSVAQAYARAPLFPPLRRGHRGGLRAVRDDRPAVGGQPRVHRRARGPVPTLDTPDGRRPSTTRAPTAPGASSPSAGRPGPASTCRARARPPTWIARNSPPRASPSNTSTIRAIRPIPSCTARSSPACRRWTSCSTWDRPRPIT